MTKRNAVWNPPAEVSREQCLADSGAVLAMPDIPQKEYEDLVRIRAVGLDWDIGAQIYEPEDPARILVGADGRKAGPISSPAATVTSRPWRWWRGFWPGSSGSKLPP